MDLHAVLLLYNDEERNIRILAADHDKVLIVYSDDRPADVMVSGYTGLEPGRLVWVPLMRVLIR